MSVNMIAASLRVSPCRINDCLLCEMIILLASSSSTVPGKKGL